MIELFSTLKDKSYRKIFQQKCNDVLLVMVIVLFPLSIKFSNYAIFMLAFNWLIYIISFKEKFPKNRRSVLINIAPFLICVLTLLYAPELKAGLHNIEKLLPLLAFPVILNTIDTRRDYTFFLKVFSICILLMSVTCFCYGLHNFIFVDENQQVLVGDYFNRVPGRWNAMTNLNLMRPFLINPIYMSLYVSFAIFVVLSEKFVNGFVKSLLVIFLIIFQFLIGSRIGLFAFFFALIVFVLQIGSKERRFYFSIFAFLVLIASVVLIFVNPVLKKRFVSDLAILSPPENVEQWNALNIRVAIWNCSWEVFKQSPILGYGVNGQYAARAACYKEKYTFHGPYGTALNSHNQYIEFALVGGPLLLGLFIAQMVYSSRIAAANGAKLHLIFIFLFAITSCGESLLETQKGIVFFVLFNSLFIYYKGKERNV
jgi:O-antigen ligase